MKTIFENESGNSVLSPYSIKVILLMLAEASGTDSETYNQLKVIYPNIRVPYEGREYNKNVLNSLSVSDIKPFIVQTTGSFQFKN